MRKLVISQELSARSWKATYEKMYYSLECEKIEPLYEDYIKRAREKFEKQKEDHAKMIEKLEASLKEEAEKENLEVEVPEQTQKAIEEIKAYQEDEVA